MPINITKAYKYRRQTRKATLPLLPGDAALLKQIKEEKEKRKVQPERLENQGPADLPWQVTATGRVRLDINKLMAQINSRMWGEIPEKGLHYETVTLTHNFRQSLAPLVMVSQIYGVFPQSTTLVDREINQLRKQGKLRLLTVNVPGANDLVIESDAFYDRMGDTEIENKLKKLLKSKPDATWLSREDLDNAGLTTHITDLLAMGHLSIEPGRPGVHNITTPQQGTFLKLLLSSRKWLIKALSVNKWKELPETSIEDKLYSSTGYWKDLKGIELEWILYDAIGAGYIEGFATPIGRGWKVLGTK